MQPSLWLMHELCPHFPYPLVPSMFKPQYSFPFFFSLCKYLLSLNLFLKLYHVQASIYSSLGQNGPLNSLLLLTYSYLNLLASSISHHYFHFIYTLLSTFLKCVYSTKSPFFLSGCQFILLVKYTKLRFEARIYVRQNIKHLSFWA